MILVSIQYQVNTGLVVLVPVLIPLTYKGSLYMGEQCLMIFEMNHHHLSILLTHFNYQ